MTESQRRPAPRVDTGELDTALAFLRFARESVLMKLEGLRDDDLHRRLVPTDTTLIGLVQHLAASERYWFGHHLAGEALSGPPDHTFFSMAVPAGRTAEAVVADYRAASSHSDEIVTAIGDPLATTAQVLDGELMTLRWVLAHMTSETARHAGHADILRELLDGTTGR